MSRHCSRLALLLLLALPGLTPAQTAEQERQALAQAIQKRFPGSGPADWLLGYEGLSATAASVVTAIPFNNENATNSADILAIGKKQWERKFADGKSFAHCFPNAGKRVAATYPQFDPKLKQIVTVEAALNHCLQLHGEATMAVTDFAAMGPLSAYFKSMADGQKLAVRVGNAAAKEKFDSGKALFHRRGGQLGFACAGCHVRHAGQLYGEQGLSFVIGQAATWPRIEPGGSVRTLQAQFQRCMTKSGAEAYAIGSDEFNNLEYYLTYLSNGMALRALTVQR